VGGRRVSRSVILMSLPHVKKNCPGLAGCWGSPHVPPEAIVVNQIWGGGPGKGQGKNGDSGVRTNWTVRTIWYSIAGRPFQRVVVRVMDSREGREREKRGESRVSDEGEAAEHQPFESNRVIVPGSRSRACPSTNNRHTLCIALVDGSTANAPSPVRDQSGIGWSMVVG
jgi:hypothetical protein